MDGGTVLLFRAHIPSGIEIYSFADQKITIAKREPNSGPSAGHHVIHPGRPQVCFYSHSGRLGRDRLRQPLEQRVYSHDIRAALASADGLYLFGVDSFVRLKSAEISVAEIAVAIDQWAPRSAPISARWGRVNNVFTRGGPVTAALLRGDHTFLAGGDQYLRYTGADYRIADEGYPRPLAANPDGLPVSFKAAIQTPDGRTCYFTGTEHVFDNAFSAPIPNQTRWGLIRTNILVRGVDTAYRIDNKHYLFSGNELASYTAGPDGNLPHYMDREPAIVEIGSFGNVRGAFTRNELLYLVGRDSFICSKVDTPEQPLPEYPRSGLAGALVADIRRQFQLPANSSDNIDQCEVHALLLQGSMLLLDTDDVVPGLRVLRLDLSTGILARDFRPFPINWAALRQDGAAFVDLPTARYSFRADKVMKTDRGVPAAWDSNHEVRSISAVWGGRPFDAAIPIDQDLFLFAGASFSRLPRAWAADTLGGTVAAGNIRTALGVRTPIRGSFTNMPAPLLDGFDAALPAASGVYIFKGDHFAHLSGDATLRPVASIKYDVVRLTTSTAARLKSRVVHRRCRGALEPSHARGSRDAGLLGFALHTGHHSREHGSRKRGYPAARRSPRFRQRKWRLPLGNLLPCPGTDRRDAEHGAALRRSEGMVRVHLRSD